MAISLLPVDQRVIDIDSRRFASIEKAVVELITNSDDSYSRIENVGDGGDGSAGNGQILISYERHQKGAVLSVMDQAEGMSFSKTISILSYGGAHSGLAQGESGGRGYFGRGLKQAIYGLGHGWIETIYNSRITRVDLYRSDKGEYLINDSDGDREAVPRDYERMGIEIGRNGTKVTIIIDYTLGNIPYFSSLVKTIRENFYLRDILKRRGVEILNLNQARKLQTSLKMEYVEPESVILIGPADEGSFHHDGKVWSFYLTLKKSLHEELVLKGDDRTNGLLVISGTAVLDCQFFNYENQLGTEFLFGSVRCDGLSEMLGRGRPVISDEREGLNLKDSFVRSFADAVSVRLTDAVKSEQLRLSHFDHARISQRTSQMVEEVLRQVNRIAIDDLGIILPPVTDDQAFGLFDKERGEVMRFSTPFYYRKVGHSFHVKLLVDRSSLLDEEILSFDYDLPDSIGLVDAPLAIPVSGLDVDGCFVWTVIGSTIGAKGSITVSCGPYGANCEVVIAESANSSGFGLPSSRGGNRARGGSIVMFRGYELRNLDNDVDRAVYDPEERLILINTEAPTVRLHVDGRGQFRDGARLLLAELLLDIISDELARHIVDKTTRKGDSEAYLEVKHDIIRRYGVTVHSVLLGG